VKILFLQIAACLATGVLTGCSPSESSGPAAILLFCGHGTSPNSVKGIEAILKDRHLGYAKVDSEQINELSAPQLSTYRLLIIPGGNYITIGKSLTPATATNVHAAVQGGLNYLGVCAGGLLAGDAKPNGLNLTSGVRFGFYAVVNQGVHKAAVPIASAGGPAIEHYWEDGPQFNGWGEVVGKYPDGTPAIVEGSSGQGWVILCGIHPEAPENWRRGLVFSTPVSAANAYAGVLIQAALNGTRLPHY
jgi:glutamine amidotransferase-like uncharacterized protein